MRLGQDWLPKVGGAKEKNIKFTIEFVKEQIVIIHVKFQARRVFRMSYTNFLSNGSTSPVRHPETLRPIFQNLSFMDYVQ